MRDERSVAGSPHAVAGLRTLWPVSLCRATEPSFGGVGRPAPSPADLRSAGDPRRTAARAANLGGGGGRPAAPPGRPAQSAGRGAERGRPVRARENCARHRKTAPARGYRGKRIWLRASTEHGVGQVNGHQAALPCLPVHPQRRPISARSDCMRINALMWSGSWDPQDRLGVDDDGLG